MLPDSSKPVSDKTRTVQFYLFEFFKLRSVESAQNSNHIGR